MSKGYEIMVLNDGETFADLEGCMRAEVLWDEFDGVLQEEEWDQKVQEFAKQIGEGGLLWVSDEYNVIAKVVETY